MGRKAESHVRSPLVGLVLEQAPRPDGISAGRAGSVKKTNAIREQLLMKLKVAQRKDTHVMTQMHLHTQVYKAVVGVAVHLKPNH